MMDSDLERRLERMYSGYATLPVDTNASWRRFIRRRRHAAIQRRAMAAGAAVAVAVTAVIAAAIAHQRNSSEPSNSHHVSRLAHGGQISITARIPQPGAASVPGDLAIAGIIVYQRGAVWSISHNDYLFKIDQRTNRVTFRERIAGLTDITAGEGQIWAVTSRGTRHGQLLKIDPVSGTVVRTFPLSDACGQVLYAGRQLWVDCGYQAADFIRLDPATGQVIAATGTLHGVTSAAASPNGIWYVGNSGVAGFLGTGKRLRWVRVNDSNVPVSLVYTNSLIYGQGSLWALTNNESVARIDPATGRIIRIYTYQTYDPGYSLGLDFFAVGMKSLWFLEDSGYQATGVLRVDLATGHPLGRVARVGSCGQPCWQIYVAGGSVWVPTQTHITRIDAVSRPPRRARR